MIILLSFFIAGYLVAVIMANGIDKYTFWVQVGVYATGLVCSVGILMGMGYYMGLV